MSLPTYTLSDSDSDGDEATDDLDSILLGIPSFSSIKLKKTSPTKSKVLKKTNEQKKKNEEEKLRKKEEKQKMLEDKKRLKAEKKKKAEILKQLKPGECIKFISAFIDSSLLNQKFGGELLTSLQNADIKYTVRDQKTPGTISWERNVDQCDMNIEDHVIVIWLWRELIELISSNTFNKTINELIRRYPSYKITIVVFGIEEYFRSNKNASNRELKRNVAPSQTKKKQNTSLDDVPRLSRLDVEMALAELQIMLNVQYKFIETNEEIGLFVSQFSKAVAELPYKLQRNKNQESTDWYAAADSKECVRVDPSGNGLSRLWQQQICQFPNVGLDVAQAVASEYCSPRVLMEAYDKCIVQKEGELLLQNIPVRRGHGPLTSVRRVGPELSKKIYHFFTTTDGNLPLS